MNCKTFLLGLLSLAFLPTASATFPDVTEETKYQSAIEYLAEQGIINGYADGNFGPENTLTRAELLKILLEAKEGFVKPNTPTEPCFPDVATTDWYAPYVCYAKAEGIVEGFPDGTMRPNKEVSLVEAAKMVVERMGLEKMPGHEYWFEGYVKTLFKYQAVPTDTVKYFEQHLTRAEISLMVKQVLNFDPKRDDYWFPSNSFVPFKYMEQKSLLLSGGIYDHEYESINKNIPEDEMEWSTYRYGFGTAEVRGYLETITENKNPFCDESGKNACETIDVSYFMVSETPENKDLNDDINTFWKHQGIRIGCEYDGEIISDIYGGPNLKKEDCDANPINRNEQQLQRLYHSIYPNNIYPGNVCTLSQRTINALQATNENNPLNVKITFIINEALDGPKTLIDCRTPVIRIQPISLSQ